VMESGYSTISGSFNSEDDFNRFIEKLGIEMNLNERIDVIVLQKIIKGFCYAKFCYCKGMAS
ncbi:MAG: hypothetical protein ACD_21C00168G0001, partial [uncultured bacterium]